MSTRCIVLVLLAWLTGCRQEAPTEIVEQPEPAPPSADFIVADAGAEPWQGRPALYLRFSQPLAGAQHFDELLAVSGPDGAAVEGSWLLEEDLATLRFPFVEPARDYRIEVNPVLMAADGRQIGAVEPLALHSGDLPPTVGFASSGLVLPMRNSDGLPIVSVNVREVDVEFLRLKDSRVAAFFAQRPRSGRRGSWELEQVAAMAEPVYAGRFALETRGGERSTSHIPVHQIPELREPGVYFAVMKRAGSFPWQHDTTFFFVSDLGLHVRGHSDGLWVQVSSLATGEPQSGVALEVQDGQGRRIASAGSDGSGQARLDYRLQGGHVLLARRGRDVAWLPFNQPALDLSEFQVGGPMQRAAEVFLWSGRDLYRPGESIRVLALLRDHDGRSLPAAQPLFGTLKQPDGRTFAGFRLEPEELGFYRFSRALPADVPTGRWTVEMRLDPAAREAHASMTLRIEEFLPERLKLDLVAEARALAPGEVLPVAVEAAYLYGAPASGNRFAARLLTTHEPHPLPELRGWHFGDPLEELPTEPVEIADLHLDEAGRGEVLLAAPERAAGPLALVLSGSVFESGGRAVNRTLKRVLWPAPALVGVRPMFDLREGPDANSRAGFEIQRHAADGTPRGGGQVTARLIRERREYFWSFLPQGGWRSDFVRRFEVVETRDVALRAEGPVRVEFALEWGEYRIEVDDPASGLTTRLPFRAGWSFGDANRGEDARPDRIKLALDRTRYRAGEEIEVTVTPPYAGPAVLLVESDRLLHSERFQARAGAKLRLRVTPEWERHDVYISVLAFRPGERGARISPSRALGVVHVPIDRSERRVVARIEAPETARPGERVAISIEAPALAGRTARVALSAVDQGVIGITRYPVPDAAAFFFARRGFGVEARDLYGRIIEDLAGRRARLRYGGDAALIAALPQARRPTAEVAIVDLFRGPITLDAAGHATIELEIPDFNGSLRLAALVFGEADYAAAESALSVRAPLVVEASSPRVLAPGDRARLTVDVQNMSGAPGRVRLRAEGDALAEVRGAIEPFELADGARRTVDFELRGGPGHGLGRLRVIAELGDQRIERGYTLPVRSPWPLERRSRQRKLESPETLRFGVDAVAGLLPGSALLRVSASTLPPLPFAAAVEGLVGYPYGCLEQTVSRALALLWLDAEGAARLGVTPVPEDTRQRWLADAFGRVSSMQQENGHFSLWPGDGMPTTQLTPWVADFLLSARESGLAIPDAVLQKTLERMHEDLLAGGPHYWDYEHTEHLRFAFNAWAGYVLARVHRAPLGTLRALHDRQRERSLTPLPLVQLGLALHLMGDTARAEAAIAEAFAREFSRPRWIGDYGTDLRDLSLALALLHRHGLARPEHDARLFDLTRTLFGTRTSAGQPTRTYWLSTQEKGALVLLARSMLAGVGRPVEVELTVGGAARPMASRNLVSRSFDAADLAAGVRMGLAAEGPVWVVEEAVGAPVSSPGVTEQGIRIRRDWYRMDGSRFEGERLREGETLLVRLSLVAKERMADALVVDLLPGGLEVENLNLGDAGQFASVVIDGQSPAQTHWGVSVRHEEYRDDRYVAALDLWPGNEARLFYLVRAVAPGRYAVPPPFVEDMYRPELRGVGEVGPEVLEVVPP
jgi:uncharacterized protein YfaS (alpha-2-macroglobulin family)